MRLALAALALAGCSASPVGPARDFSAHPAIVELDAPPVTYAVSDVHGGYARLVALLVRHHVLSEVPASPGAARWTAGDAALVIAGDLVDKGPEGIEVIELLRALESDAAAKGGRVVVLAGNHEAEFLDDPGNSKASKPDGLDAELDADHLDPADFAAGEDPRGLWLRNLAFGARVGAWFFSHAGDTGGRSVAELERALEGALRDGGYGDPEVTGEGSILESRDWYADDDGIGARYAAAVGAEHLVFGHDPHALGADGEIATGQGGALFRIDCGMSPDVDYSAGALLRIRHDASGDVADELPAEGDPRAVWPGK